LLPTQAATEVIFIDAAGVVLEEFQPAFFEDRAFASFFDTVLQ
jgi:hypothetical protein